MMNPNAQDELFKPVDVEKPNYIKVIGVGGGGGNAVNHMRRKASRASTSYSATPTTKPC